MPLRPLRPCRNPVCPTTTRNVSGYCDKCEPEAKLRAKVFAQAREKARGTASERGYGKLWKTIRRIVLEEARGLCADCREKGIYVAATEVHHADGNSRNNNKTNLVPLCRTCHDSRHGGAGPWRPSIKSEEAQYAQRS